MLRILGLRLLKQPGGALLMTGRYRSYREFGLLIREHMGGCPNYGPFSDPYYSTAPNI